jgi:hypothetical protein
MFRTQVLLHLEKNIKAKIKYLNYIRNISQSKEPKAHHTFCVCNKELIRCGRDSQQLITVCLETSNKEFSFQTHNNSLNPSVSRHYESKYYMPLGLCPTAWVKVLQHGLALIIVPYMQKLKASNGSSHIIYKEDSSWSSLLCSSTLRAFTS